MGLAILPGPTKPLVMENHPTSLITSSTILWSRQEVSGATPGGIVVFFADVGPTSGPGAIIPSLSIPGFGGELFGDGSVFLLATLIADGGGYVGNVVTLPDTLIGTGLHLIFQGFDVATFSFSTPAPIQYL